MSKAPAPNDIIWDNVSVGKKEFIVRYMVATFVTICILTVCFFIILGLKVGQGKLRESQGQSSWGIRIMSIFISVVILAINEILAYAIRWLTHHEKHKTLTNMNLSLINKISVAQFLNTCILVVVVHVIQNKPSYKIDIKGKLTETLISRWHLRGRVFHLHFRSVRHTFAGNI